MRQPQPISGILRGKLFPTSFDVVDQIGTAWHHKRIHKGTRYANQLGLVSFSSLMKDGVMKLASCLACCELRHGVRPCREVHSGKQAALAAVVYQEDRDGFPLPR